MSIEKSTEDGYFVFTFTNLRHFEQYSQRCGDLIHEIDKAPSHSVISNDVDRSIKIKSSLYEKHFKILFE